MDPRIKKRAGTGKGDKTGVAKVRTTRPTFHRMLIDEGGQVRQLHRLSRSELFEQAVVFGVRADPKPEERVALFEPERQPADSDADGVDG